MTLSFKTRESIKTALAMTIALGIALRMDWGHTMWAGFAVAFVSLNSVGQSMNKAALRMVGTFAGIVVALVLVALFLQQRWMFFAWLTVWLSICMYMMGGARHQYFWHVCGFVCVIVCMDAGPDSANAFSTAMLRAQQTGLGILVYGLVSLFLWPTSSGPAFRKTAIELAELQRALFRADFDLATGDGEVAVVAKKEDEEASVRAAAAPLLEAAQTDDYQISEQYGEWSRYQALTAELAETMDRWRQSVADAATLDLEKNISGFSAFGTEIEARLAAVHAMLSGKAPEHQPADCDLATNRQPVAHLSHFQRAGVAVCLSRSCRLDELSRELFDCVSFLQGFASEPPAVPARLPPVRELLVLDPDRIVSVIRLIATLWLAILGYIFVNGLPGGTGLISFATSIGMALASMPQLPVSLLYKPAATGVAIGATVSLFLMPHLSTFAALGLLIFGVTFFICYVYAAPQQMLGRAFGLAFFLALAAIDNDQTYSFLAVANTAMMLPILMIVLGIAANIPVSARAEHSFLRLLRRFFTSCEYLTATLAEGLDQPFSRRQRLAWAFHSREVRTLPTKLAGWAKFMGPDALKGNTPAQVGSLIASLRGIERSIAELREEYALPHSPYLKKELGPDIGEWRLAVREGFHRLAANPSVAGRDAFRGTVDAITARIEQRVATTLNNTHGMAVSDQEAMDLYKLLGAYHGMSEELVNYAGLSADIDWVKWGEERFA